MPREWNSEEREPWNPKIASIIKTIDLHNVYYLNGGDERHLLMAQMLREYVCELKEWLSEAETGRFIEHDLERCRENGGAV